MSFLPTRVLSTNPCPSCQQHLSSLSLFPTNNTCPSYQQYLSFLTPFLVGFVLQTPVPLINNCLSYQHLSIYVSFEDLVNQHLSMHLSYPYLFLLTPILSTITMISLQLSLHAPQNIPYSVPSAVVPQVGGHAVLSLPTGGEMKKYCTSNGLHSVL